MEKQHGLEKNCKSRVVGRCGHEDRGGQKQNANAQKSPLQEPLGTILCVGGPILLEQQ